MNTRNKLPYGSGDVERYAGVSQAVLRDWRRRGLLEALGQETNGRWRYDGNDLVCFAVISQITKTSIVDLQTAWEFCHVIANLVIDRIRGKIVPATDGRYFFGWPRESDDETIPIAAIDNDIDRAMARSPSPVAVCIDLEKLKETLPDALIKLVRAPTDEPSK